MTRQVIAKIKLSPGQGGFYDPVSRIHLTYGAPVAEVYAGTNTEGLKKALRNRTISLLTGSLGEHKQPFKLVRRENGKVVLVRTDNDNKVTVEEPKTVTAKVVPKTKKQEAKEVKKDTVPVVQEEPKSVKGQSSAAQDKVAETKPVEPVAVTVAVEKKEEKPVQQQNNTGYDYSRNKKKDKNKNEKE